VCSAAEGPRERATESEPAAVSRQRNRHFAQPCVVIPGIFVGFSGGKFGPSFVSTLQTAETLPIVDIVDLVTETNCRYEVERLSPVVP